MPLRTLRAETSSPRRLPRWIYPLIALLSLPAVAAAWVSLWEMLRGFPGRWGDVWPFFTGVGLYILIQVLFKKPLGLYVFGHELTHAITAMLSGYRVKSFKVSPQGGEVLLTDTNVFVALSPYFIPFYTLLAAAVFQLVKLYAPFPLSSHWLDGTVGFTLAFHLALTFHALAQRQPDMGYVGLLFSFALILTANALVLVLVLKGLFPQYISLKYFFNRWFANSLFMGERGACFIWVGLQRAWTFGKSFYE